VLLWLLTLLLPVLMPDEWHVVTVVADVAVVDDAGPNEVTLRRPEVLGTLKTLPLKSLHVSVKHKKLTRIMYVTYVCMYKQHVKMKMVVAKYLRA
jgi:hypothetical protein